MTDLIWNGLFTRTIVWITDIEIGLVIIYESDRNYQHPPFSLLKFLNILKAIIHHEEIITMLTNILVENKFRSKKQS